MARKNQSKVRLTTLLCLQSFFLILFTHHAFSAETSDWLTRDNTNKSLIDHLQWQIILDKYLVTNTESGVNLFNYKEVSSQDQKALFTYLSTLQAQDPRRYNKAVQKAYWINLYNALTVQLILDNYPTKSIKKLGQTFFSFGPWDDKAATIAGEDLSLNDIEHKILRPIFKDPRIHYAVNCASFSCPNLSAHAYTSLNIDTLLTQGAYNYINHNRAVQVNGHDLLLSSIYDWYLVDFGGSTQSLVKHLTKFAKDDLKQTLMSFKINSGDIDYHYDWQLNELK